MMMIFGLIRVLATLFFLYLIWRKLREDYKEDDLLTYSWVVLIGYLLGGRVVYGLINWGIWNDSIWDWMAVFTKPGFDYIGGVAASMVTTALFANAKGWKVWNLLEDMTPIMLSFLTIMLLGEVVMSRFNLVTLFWLMAVVVSGLAVNSLKNKYRSFVWYPSGKKGFLFLTANIVFGIGGLAVAWWFKSNGWILGLMAAWGLISVMGLVILGEINLKLLFNKK